jgi:hypothetical protein
MSRTLIKKESYPPFMLGMLVAFMIVFLIWYLHPKSNHTHTGSLPFEVACVDNQKLITSAFTERKLESVPIKPKKTETEDETDGKSKDEADDKSTDETDDGKTDDDTKRSYTPIPGPEPIVGPGKDDGIIVDPPISGTQEGGIIPNGIIVPSNGTSTVVTPTTERDADIPSTTTTTEDAQNSQDGEVIVRIIRKFG